MNPLGAVIFYFEFVSWFMVACCVIAVAILPINLIYNRFTRGKR